MNVSFNPLILPLGTPRTDKIRLNNEGNDFRQGHHPALKKKVVRISPATSNSFLTNQYSLNRSRYFPFITKRKDPLPCSQKPATGPYPGPVESSPHPHSLLQDTFQYYLTIHAKVFQVGSCLQFSQLKFNVRFPHVPISLTSHK